MKKLLIMVSAAVFVLLSCTDKKAQNSSDNGLSAQKQQEIQADERLAEEYEAAATKIEEKSAELDVLLEEIDN